MPGPWTDATDRQLLLTIIHLSAPQLPKWDKVAELMGPGFTAESTRQHFQKLRKDSKAKFDGVEGGALNTPSRKRKDTPAKSTGKGKGKGKLNGDVNGHDGAEYDEEEESPLKKVKGAKVEDAGDEDAFA